MPNLREPPEIYLYQTARQREMEKAQYNWDGNAICHPVCGWGWKQSEGKKWYAYIQSHAVCWKGAVTQAAGLLWTCPSSPAEQSDITDWCMS